MAALPAELPVDDVSVVVSGSLRRGEFTPSSDIDWNLLLDGVADPGHFDFIHDIGSALEPFAAKDPGPEGTFGCSIVSHDLIHLIGGEDDTNINLTRRVLLLLESRAIGPAIAFDRTSANVLKRYLVEDRSFWKGTTGSGHHIPHFLLNDLTRFWRTMAVDFAYKLRDRGGRGGTIRNLKLRMSRKLLFAAGLLACFRCHLDFLKQADIYRDSPSTVTDHVERIFRLVPTDMVASILVRFPHLDAQALRLFDAYDGFLGLLADEEKRKHLEKDPPDSDPIRKEAFSATREFREALLDIFFDQHSGIGALTRRYGIF